MQYPWLKTVVGALLAANFCVPLATVVSNRHLWEEPMAVLAGNMSLTTTLFGIIHALVGIYSLSDFQSVTLCRLLQYSSFGVVIAFKTAQVGAAVDQFVAVVHPLRHYPIMMRAQPWLLAVTWLTCGGHILFGFVAHMLDMETFSENSASQGNNTAFTGCRWETALANVFTIVVELETVIISLVSASFLVYTRVVGYRVKAQVMKEERQLRQEGIIIGNDNQTFLDNYRAFKNIMIVLSLAISMDIVAPILRISSRWYPQPRLNGLLHQVRLFCLIFEGWAYGLLNAKLRAAYKKTFCCRFHRVESAVIEQNPPPQRTTAAPTAAAATAAAAAAATATTAAAVTAATIAAATTATATTAAAPLELYSIGSAVEAEGRYQL